MVFSFQLNGQDLRNSPHDVAVGAIRHATSPMEFVVERLTEQALLPLSQPQVDIFISY